MTSLIKRGLGDGNSSAQTCLATLRPMLACPTCGAENAATAKFCSECGARLAASAPAREVRKTVTVVFCDVTGSTTLGEQLDPEALRHVIGRYFDAMREVIEAHGGTVEKFIGDAVMAVFGVPTLHEDDALRAVRAAAGMGEALARLNEQLEAERGVRIAIRTGVMTGEVVTDESAASQRLVTGDTVNTAARLEQAAKPGEVLIGDPTYRLVRDAVTVEPVEPVEAKGKAEGVRAHRLTTVLAGAAGTARHLDSPMVGRARELALVADAFSRAEAGPSCHLVTVLGSAGVGKSRLTEEVLSGLRGRATVLRGRCLSYGNDITFYPVADIVRQAAGIDERDGPAESRAKLEGLVTGYDAPVIVERVAQVLGVGSPTDVSAATEELFWGVRKLLESIASRRPAVVVVDDVHWAEPTLLDLLEHVADWSRDAPILLLCLGRPELLDGRPGWGGGKLNATSALLEPLTDTEAGELIENLLGHARLPVGIRSRVVRAAGGNPLFVEEMLGMLIDDGLLIREDGQWRAAGDLDAIAVPPTIQALLSARLDRLGPGERAVLERASLEGTVFHTGAVAALSPDPERGDVRSHLMSLVRKELIRPAGAELPGEDAFRFRHVLIREATYDAVSKDARAALHERYANWLEGRLGDRAPEYAEFLGYHLEQAHRYRLELRPGDEHAVELASRAATFLAAAGRRAMSRGDVSGATGLLGRTAKLLPAEDPDRPKLLLDLGMVAADIDLARADAILAGAIESAEAVGDRNVADRARLERIAVRSLTDPSFGFEASKREAERLLPDLEARGDHLAAFSAWKVIATADWSLCRYGESAREVARAADHARAAGDDRLVIEAMGAGAAAGYFGPKPAREGLAHAEELLGLIGPMRAQTALVTGGLAIHRAMLGDLDEARRLLAQARGIAQELGSRSVLASMAEVGGAIETWAGDSVAAEREYRWGIEQLQAMGNTANLSTQAGELGGTLFDQGRWDEAEKFARVCRENAAEEDVASQVQWRQVHALVLAARGTHQEAQALAREAVALIEATDSLNFQGDTWVDLAEVLRMGGRETEAVEALRTALQRYERKGNVIAAGQVRTLIGRLTASTA
jgi:class 3 adenylate cyclase/tetratricopeptide (TPR) repeat protein